MDQPPSDRPGSEDSEEVRIGWQMAGLGFQASSEAIAGAGLGWLFDRWRGTGPTGVLVGASIGIVVGLFTLVRRSMQLNRRLDDIARRRRAERGPIEPPATEVRSSDDDGWDDDWNNDDDDDTWSEADRSAGR